MIEFKNIKKIYPLGENSVTVLDIEHFEIKEGDYVALVGPSGSGKTTFLNVIGLMGKPTEGEVYIENENALDFKGEDLSKFRRDTMYPLMMIGQQCVFDM